MSLSVACLVIESVAPIARTLTSADIKNFMVDVTMLTPFWIYLNHIRSSCDVNECVAVKILDQSIERTPTQEYCRACPYQGPVTVLAPFGYMEFSAVSFDMI